MASDILEGLELRFRPSNGRPLMTEFLKEHMFDIPQSPLIDPEMLRLKTSSPQNQKSYLGEKSSPLHFDRSEVVGKNDEAILPSDAKSNDAATQVESESFSSLTITGNLPSAKKRIHQNSSKIMDTAQRKSDGNSTPKRAKMRQTLSISNIPPVSSKIGDTQSFRAVPASLNKKSTKYDQKSDKNHFVNADMGIVDDNPEIFLSKPSDELNSSGSPKHISEKNCSHFAADGHQKGERIIFNDELLNTVELINNDFRTKRASYIWNKFFPEKSHELVESSNSNELACLSPKLLYEEHRYRYGVSKICSIGKKSVKTFNAVCEYVEEWNNAEKLNQNHYGNS